MIASILAAAALAVLFAGFAAKWAANQRAWKRPGQRRLP